MNCEWIFLTSSNELASQEEVKILKSGKTSQTVNCEFCAAEIQFSDADIKPNLLPDWFEGGPIINCPECDRSTHVKRVAEWRGFSRGGYAIKGDPQKQYKFPWSTVGVFGWFIILLGFALWLIIKDL